MPSTFPPPRPALAEIVGGGPRRWWIPVAAVLFVVAAVVAAVVVLRGSPGDGHPERVAVSFLQSRSCDEARALADQHLRAKLGRRNCRILTDAAKGLRTYADPHRDRQLTRRLNAGDPDVNDNRAQVPVTVAYSGTRPVPEAERMVVMLVRSGDRWLVDDWGMLR